MSKKSGANPNDFGKKGWIIVIISMFYWLIGTSLVSDGMNTIIPAFMEQYGWTRTQMTLFGTIGGWVSVLGIMVFGKMALKIGSKNTILIGGVGALAATILLGYSNSLAMYGAAVILYYVMVTAMNGIGVQNIGAEWFPRKKGMFMGISTMGITLGWGIVMMCAGGILGQTVMALVSYGHEPSLAIWCFTWLFPVGFGCSYIGGLIDNKWGTRAGSLFTAALLALGAIVILLFGSNAVAAVVGVGLFMGAMSAGNNMTMSITTSVWGRYDFPNAWRVISVTTKLVTSTGIVLMSLIADMTGSYQASFAAMLASAVISAIIIFFTDERCIGRTEEEMAAK